MTTPEFAAMDRDLHPQAQRLILTYTEEYSVALLTQAKLLAYRERADVVLSNHVIDARTFIFREKQSRTWRKLSAALGGALVGAFIQGLITALTREQLAAIEISIYLAVGFVSIPLLVWGLGE